MAIEMLRYRIIESIKLLASDGNIQLSCYPEFVCKGDEIANSLADWLLLYQNQMKTEKAGAFSPDELEQIIGLNDMISKLSPEVFSDYSILTSYKWENIRNVAKKILLLLNEEYSLPDKNSI